MPDNVGVTPGTGAAIATDELPDLSHAQRIKIMLGGDGEDGGNVSAANRLPVSTPTSAAPLSGLEAGSLTRIVPASVRRCSFANVGSGLLTSDLVQIGSTGTGITVSQSAGNLVIAAGTTANAEFLARSTFTVKGAHAFRLGTLLSQRIAQNNFHVMLADLIDAGLSFNILSATSVNVTLPSHGFTAQNVGQAMFLGAISGAAGVPGRYVIASIPDANTIRFTVAGWPASGTGTLCLFGHNYHQFIFDGTTATNVKYDAQRKGWASGDTTLTINTSASPGVILHAQSDGSDASAADSLRASNTGYQFTTRGSRVENLPDLDADLYLFIWSRNGTTNPASGTTWTINFVSVEDLENIKVALSGATRNGQGNAIPVNGTMTISGTPTVNAALNGGTNTIGGVRLVADAGQGAGTSHRTVFATNITTGVPTLIKNGATQLNSLRVANNCGVGVWVHLYNRTTAPTLGTDTPEVSIFCPNGQTTPLDTGAYADRFGTGLAYSIVDNCAAVPAVGGTITIAGGAAAICLSARYT
jgi:hypothetical protein